MIWSVNIRLRHDDVVVVNAFFQTLEDVLRHLALLGLVGFLSGCHSFRGVYGDATLFCIIFRLEVSRKGDIFDLIYAIGERLSHLGGLVADLGLGCQHLLVSQVCQVLVSIPADLATVACGSCLPLVRWQCFLRGCLFTRIWSIDWHACCIHGTS